MTEKSENYGDGHADPHKYSINGITIY